MGRKLDLFARVFVFALVIAASSLFLTVSGKSVWLAAAVAIAAAVALVGVIVGSERIKAQKAGLPFEDELSKKVSWKAGYYAFLVSLWLAIGIMIANMLSVEFFKQPDIEFRYAFEAIIIVPAIVFIVLALRFKSKGKID